MLPVAYHNFGVECEYLGRHQEALDAYLKAVDAARLRLGPTDQLTVAMQNALDAAIKAGPREPPREASKGARNDMSAPWSKNTHLTPRTRHKDPLHTAPLAAHAHRTRGGVPPPGQGGEMYELTTGENKRRIKTKAKSKTRSMEQVLGFLPPIDGAVDVAGFRTSRGEGDMPLVLQRAEWERLPWNHVQVDMLNDEDEDEDEDDFRPPPPSNPQQTLANIYGSSLTKKTDQQPRPPPKLPPGVLYRPKVLIHNDTHCLCHCKFNRL